MDIRVDPRTFHDFQFKIAMSLRLPPTSRRILEEFVDADVNAEAVCRVVQKNQYFEYMLLQEIKSLGMKENTPTLLAAISLLGMSRVRDFICALQIMRMVGRKHPSVSADGKLEFKAGDYLKYARHAEEYMTNRKIQYADTGYAAGLMFDILIAVGRELYESSKPFEEYVGEVYKHGLRSAAVGLELAKSIKNFSLMKFVFSTCLVHDIGKIAMDLLFPPTKPNSYSGFRGDIGKSAVSRDVRMFVEAKRFGLTHDYYGSQMAYYFGVLRPVEKAILFHHDPYLLKAGNKEMHSLAMLVALASNVANNFRAPKDTADPLYKVWFTPEIKDLRIDPKAMIVLMHKLGRETF